MLNNPFLSGAQRFRCKAARGGPSEAYFRYAATSARAGQRGNGPFSQLLESVVPTSERPPLIVIPSSTSRELPLLADEIRRALTAGHPYEVVAWTTVHRRVVGAPRAVRAADRAGPGGPAPHFGQTAASRGFDHARRGHRAPGRDLQTTRRISALLALAKDYDIVSGWRKNRRTVRQPAAALPAGQLVISRVTGIAPRLRCT